MSPEVRADSYQGKVVRVLSETSWMDANDVAGELYWPVDETIRVLAELHRAGFLDRREIDTDGQVEFEYQRAEDVQLHQE